MQATLIYNQKAGATDSLSADELTRALDAAGYAAVCHTTEQEADLDGALADVEGLVVAAGGDGTLRAVASQLVGRDVPLALLPLGTANNVGHTLGVEGQPLEIIERLARPRKTGFDVGRVRAPWGERYFLEGMGYGFFADNLALYDPERGKSIFRGISTFATTLTSYRAYDCRMRLDGVDIGGSYLLVEVLNTPAVGPRLRLAPDADPGDGFFELVAVDSDQEESFFRYVTGLLTGNFEELPSVEGYTGRTLTIEWHGFPIHVDAEVLPNGVEWTLDEETGEIHPTTAEKPATVQVDLLPHALELWLPR